MKKYLNRLKTEFILSGGVNFETGKAELLNAAYPELEKVLKVMRIIRKLSGKLRDIQIIQDH